MRFSIFAKLHNFQQTNKQLKHFLTSCLHIVSNRKVFNKISKLPLVIEADQQETKPFAENILIN